MALVRTLPEGEDFYIRDNRVVVETIVSDNEFIRCARKTTLKSKYRKAKPSSCSKEVFASVGARGLGWPRPIVIEAPRSMMILRGDNYRKGPPPKR